MTFPLQQLAQRIRLASKTIPFVSEAGVVASVSPSGFSVEGLSHLLEIGSLVEVDADRGRQLAEVIRLSRSTALCKPYDSRVTFRLGSRVLPVREMHFFPDDTWKGRIIDALARPVDGGGPLALGDVAVRLSSPPPPAMRRRLVGTGIRTGIRVVDAFTPICLGQRIGIFAGSGVGKSTLLSMLTQTQAFDDVIVALVGERGREVREFTEVTLGDAARNAIIVVSTGDESAMMRRTAPLLATALAEWRRDLGRNVLLIMDSVTRYAQACRETALAAGEPPVARGFPPSVFSDLPQLLERAGPGIESGGTITGIYSVLVDGDDHNDPVADAVRGTLDGHLVLDRAIAELGRFPALNILSSISRLADRAWTKEQAKTILELKRLIARYEDTRDLRAIGGYVPGGDPELDKAMDVVPRLYDVLSQKPSERLSGDAFRDIVAAVAPTAAKSS